MSTAPPRQLPQTEFCGTSSLSCCAVDEEEIENPFTNRGKLGTQQEIQKGGNLQKPSRVEKRAPGDRHLLPVFGMGTHIVERENQLQEVVH